jgi:hypothetical protein
MSSNEVQVVVMAALEASPLLPSVYDRVPAKTPRPYGVYGPPVRTRRGVLGKRSVRHSIEINWYGDERTTLADGSERVHANRQVDGYADACRELLDGRPLELTDGTMVFLRWVDDTSLPEAENNVRRVRQIFRIDTEEPA